MLHKTHLFTARTKGYRTFRVPGILCTTRGVLLATAEARRGRGGDWDGNDVVMRRSIDGGKTWAPLAVAAASETYGPGPISNFVMIDESASADVVALFCHNYARIFLTRSADDGATWSTPVEITETFVPFHEQYPWRVIATGPGHGIQLERGPHAGRLVVPLWMSDGSGTEFGAGHLGHRPSVVASVHSDDGGKTWHRGEIVIRTEGEFVNPSETIPVELSDGRVMFNIRSESDRHRRLVSISDDGATGWSAPTFDDALIEPVCMASILRLADGDVVFVNPNTLDRDFVKPDSVARDRKNLTCRLSSDDGATWPVSRVIEHGPSSYSDLAQLPDGTLCCIYENGKLERQNDTAYVTVARFDRDWLV